MEVKDYRDMNPSVKAPAVDINFESFDKI